MDTKLIQLVNDEFILINKIYENKIFLFDSNTVTYVSDCDTLIPYKLDTNNQIEEI